MSEGAEDRHSETDAAQRRLVLGTAGHIDHGKTALVRALTGTDTDRLPEEQARGITIDLGFAALELPGLGSLSVVDVPGHEGLVRTMVSGATGIDMVLLVVAADEGVMPQTREHVAICDLLGIERGVVALTKTDVADEDFIELASEEVAELLATTHLANSPIIPVSSQTGVGLDALREALTTVIGQSDPRTTRGGPPRLCVDRIFAMRGFGSVVTGTLVGDALKVGETIELLPSGKRSKIRGLQNHGQQVKELAPGARCAANLQGLEVAEIRRGDVVSRPDRLLVSQTADVKLLWLESAPASEDSVSVEFLTGTSERRARLAPIGSDGFRPGERGYARLHIDGEGVAMLPGDRFIVRGFARVEGAGATIGGGTILDVAPPHRRRSDPALLRELEILDRGELPQCLREHVRRAGFAGLDIRTLDKQIGRSTAELRTQLQELAAQGGIHPAGANLFLETKLIEHMQETLLARLNAFHAAEPMRPGMPRAALRGQLPDNVPSDAAELVLTLLEQTGQLCSEGELVRRPDHSPTLDAEAKAAVEKIIAEASAAGLDPPNPRDWADRLGVPLERFRDLVAHLERGGQLLRAPGDLWFDKLAVDELCHRVSQHFEQNEELDTQTYKSLIGTSRRTAMPLMELLDELHITRRQGEVRLLRNPFVPS